MDPQATPQPPAPVPEQTITTIYRHIFGLAVLYIEVILATVASLVLVYVLVPAVAGSVSPDSTSTSMWLSVITIVVLAAMAVILVLITLIYRLNKLVITNKGITEYAQNGLFRRRISRLNYSDIEDSNDEQRGVFAFLFGYGTLTVETAAEEENFIFVYCPNPNSVAQLIIKTKQNLPPEHSE